MSEGEPAVKGGAPAAKRGRRGLFVAAGAVLLLGAGGAGGAWYMGMLPFGHADAASAAPPPPVFVPLPDMVANLNGTARRPVYVKVRAQLEVASPRTVALAQAAMPRLLDLFNTFLRETRPEELRGSAGMHRLREELLARANIALPEGSVIDVLFLEIMVQ